MTKVYFASGISDTARKEYQKEIVNKIRKIKPDWDIYAAAENNSINDKSNDPTPKDIYNGDIERIKESDIFIVCISGGNEDGTLSEIGMVAGWNEAIFYKDPIKIIAYTTNERLMQPQFWHEIASGGFNHLVAGMIDKWGVFVGGEKEMLEYIRAING